jgi:hypothetical protein
MPRFIASLAREPKALHGSLVDLAERHLHLLIQLLLVTT